jgi:3-hydroxy acid dehydrogenase / malonic semialdehyde reductase
MLHAAEVADAVWYVVTRSTRTDVANLRIEPRIQKTS